ncbi:hypothetical protein ACIRRA_42440 [Nocardia sp. NPDC101769]|uniref:hypothetical protein n=1 Tax=Nocardia sp. NPDC101769 TaxID=3364333 RepID=UPI00380744EF
MISTQTPAMTAMMNEQPGRDIASYGEMLNAFVSNAAPGPQMPTPVLWPEVPADLAATFLQLDRLRLRATLLPDKVNPGGLSD